MADSVPKSRALADSSSGFAGDVGDQLDVRRTEEDRAHPAAEGDDEQLAQGQHRPGRGRPGCWRAARPPRGR